MGGHPPVPPIIPPIDIMNIYTFISLKLWKFNLKYKLIAQTAAVFEIYNMHLTDLLQIFQNTVIVIKQDEKHDLRNFQKVVQM